jgi:dTMP kinase
MQTKNGLFIVLEGGEGVGKSTNLQFIQQFLQQANIPLQSTREPGGTEIAEQIRALILKKQAEPMADLTELLLMFAARAQHLTQKIQPALAQGQWLLCDRFTDATYAYQGGGRQLNKSVIEQLEQLVQNDLRPDCVILLDAPIEVGMQRAVARAELDRMEQENRQFHQRVRDAYLSRAAQNPQRYAVIDASQALEQVQADIQQVLEHLIAQWHGA